MPKAQFTESTSADPVERAIARKVTNILNDRALDREQRKALVQRAQRELIEHRQHKASQAQLARNTANARLPTGYQQRGTQVANGRVLEQFSSAIPALFGWTQGKHPCGASRDREAESA